MLEQIQRLIFETHNLCNLNHARCPTSLEKEPSHLPLSRVIQVMDFFGRHQWQGKVAFHNYNEPLMDPRLGIFIREAHDRGWPTQIWTNGTLLSQALIDDLCTMGVMEFSVSLYNERETERLQKMDWWGRPAHLHPSANLDDRLHWHELDEQEGCRPCQWPSKNFLVRHDGTVGLCCFDWANRTKLGTINDPLWDLIAHRARIAEALAQGERNVPFCKVCPITP